MRQAHGDPGRFCLGLLFFKGSSLPGLVYLHRVITVIFVTLLLSACKSLVADISQAAQANFQQMLVNSFSEKLTEGIDVAVGQLAAEGGFLNDPLVRILLPPPLGLVIDVARDVNENPEAALLETLMNRAAENAIPVAGPILKEIVTRMDADTLQKLVESPRTAATDLLMAEGSAALQAALLPAVTQDLQNNGAIKLYGEMLQTHQNVVASIDSAATATEQATSLQSVSEDELGQYVAQQAMGGLFKKVAAEEVAVRESMNDFLESPL